MCITNLSNDEITKIKVIDIHELRNFGIHHFLCWNHFGYQILVWTCCFSKFQIWNVQILSNDKMTKIKVVDIHELSNFGIRHFLRWNHFGSQILVRAYHFPKFQIWKVQILSNDEMTNIKVVGLHYFYNFDISNFHLRSFGVSKLF
jgi:hypothetical protein